MLVQLLAATDVGAEDLQPPYYRRLLFWAKFSAEPLLRQGAILQPRKRDLSDVALANRLRIIGIGSTHATGRHLEPVGGPWQSLFIVTETQTLKGKELKRLAP
ncbi:unnamed protein product [Prunus armeniaca]|uniref:Uncharacterized protein n=1 Tax=Prunus armeniaca TaxID=36596 RepID=A0A6J5U1B3_PRUAR|nr:unnamed protein product [Prunus armeniaca]